MNHLVLIIKGFIIGIGKVIPGVSGSLIAVSLGIYEEAIEAISKFFKNFYKNIIFLGTVAIGILLAIIFGSKVINYLLIISYVPTMLLFTGLIIGTVPSIFKNISINCKNKYVYIFISALIILSLEFINFNNNYLPSNNLSDYIYILVLGLIDAITMVVPGVSGTAIFIIMGSYSFILTLFGNALNIDYVINNIWYYVFFAIGLIMGVIFISKLMAYLFKKNTNEVYMIIVGFSLSSIILLLKNILILQYNFYELLIGILLFIIGFKISSRLEK